MEENQKPEEQAEVKPQDSELVSENNEPKEVETSEALSPDAPPNEHPVESADNSENIGEVSNSGETTHGAQEFTQESQAEASSPEAPEVETVQATEPNSQASEAPSLEEPELSNTPQFGPALPEPAPGQNIPVSESEIKKVLQEALPKKNEEEDYLQGEITPVSTAERQILVVDEEGSRRSETVTIINKILPNATVEIADDPEEAQEVMEQGEFDTYVVNFLMPGFSSSQFVKDVCNHPDRPLLIGFAADKMSDAVDPKKGLKIIPLKRLFELESDGNSDEEE